MRTNALFAVVLLAACSKPTTAAGSLGAAIDFRSHLPGDVAARAPNDANAKLYERISDVHGATVRLQWRAFEDGASKYLLSAQWAVEKPSSGLTLESLGAVGTPTNRGTTDAVLETMQVGIRWRDEGHLFSTSFGETHVALSADGTSTDE